MSYSREIYERAQQIIDDRKKAAEKAAEGRRALFAALEPSYTALKTEMLRSVQEAVNVIGMDPLKAPEFMEKLKIRNLTAQAQIKELLHKNNLPDDYLREKYFCEKCEDTGVFNGKLCECHLQLLKTLAYEQAGKNSPLKFSRFSDFSLNYYPKEYNDEIKCSPRERMEQIFGFCKAYAADFDLSSPSLMLYGETGLGKTHLSLAIAGEVINKGYSVLYNSAQNIFTALEREKFGKSTSPDMYEPMVLESELLVIDDLGAEFSTAFTNAALYNIINTRINCGLPTVINTNLDLHALEERYTRRISSRIIGEYSLLSFFGSDIRQLRRTEENT